LELFLEDKAMRREDKDKERMMRSDNENEKR